VVTRTRDQAPEFAERLRELGATPILFPTIRIAPMDDYQSLDAAISNIQRYDWVVFTSVNGVDFFQQRLSDLSIGRDQISGVRVAAIGPATGDALAQIGLAPDFIPQEFVAERIAQGLGNVEGQQILLPRAQQARPTLTALLRQEGANVDEIAAYRTVPGQPSPGSMRQLADADVITFTSSSTVRNFVSIVGGSDEALGLLSGIHIACIGPITAKTVRDLGLQPHIIAEHYTIEGLIDALITYLRP
jgi:uroporphyrinogen III methyltransferase/synthase